MLLQSHQRAGAPPEQNYLIDILPALPSAWPSGSVKGLVARGSFVVDITWDAGKPTRVVLTSRLGNPCTLKIADRRQALTTEAGKTYTFDSQLRAAQ
jgi:alpha-L-fucosidase 2